MTICTNIFPKHILKLRIIKSVIYSGGSSPREITSGKWIKLLSVLFLDVPFYKLLLREKLYDKNLSKFSFSLVFGETSNVIFALKLFL